MNPDNRGSSGGSRPGKHRDAPAPLPDKSNPKPSEPGGFEPVEGLTRSIVEGPIVPVWQSDQVPGAYPREAGETPPPLASYADVSGPRPPDPLPTQSPPAPMGMHPHLAERERRKKG